MQRTAPTAQATGTLAQTAVKPASLPRLYVRISAPSEGAKQRMRTVP